MTDHTADSPLAPSTKRSSASRRLNPVSAFLATFGIYFAAYPISQLLTWIAAIIYLQINNIPVGSGADIVRTSVVMQFIVTGLFYGTVAVLLAAFLRMCRLRFRDIGWTKFVSKYIGYAVVGFLAYFAMTTLVSVLVRQLVPGIDFDQKQQIGFESAAAGYQLVFVFLSLVVLPPLVEELLTRGLLYTGLRSRLSVIPAAIVTSLVFAVAHLQFGSGAPLLWTAAIDTFLLSLVLCHLREKTGSLWPGIGLHALKNGIAFMALFVFHLV